MSTVQPKDSVTCDSIEQFKKNHEVLGIVLSDIHLSHKSPISRSAEPDWYEAMRRPLDELRYVHAFFGEPKVFIAGDIFDKWDSKAELITFAANNLPPFVSIPGNHDLPYHSISNLDKSAYGTLMLTKNRYLLRPGYSYLVGKYELKSTLGEKCDVALLHQYVWADNSTKYVGADPNDYCAKLHNKMATNKTRLAVVGDNHKGFISTKHHEGAKSTTIFNCGAFIPRKSDEQSYKPMIGLIHDNLQITSYYLDTSKDKWANEDEIKILTQRMTDADQVVSTLKKLAGASIDFEDAAKRWIKSHNVEKATADFIFEAIEEAKE